MSALVPPSPVGALTSSASGSSPLPPLLRAWRVRVFVATWLCYAGFYFCRKPFYIVKKPLGDALHFDARTLGEIGAVYLVCYALSQFLAGALGNRFGSRVVLLSGIAVSILCNVGFALATNAAAFYVLMGINGMAQATGWSNCLGTMASWFHRGERGRVMGLWATNFQVGGVLANALASFALGVSDWRGALFAGAAVLLAVWLVVAAWQRNRPEDVGLPPVADPPELSASGEVVPAAVNDNERALPPGALTNILLVGAFYFFAKVIRYALWSWAPYFFAKSFGVEPGRAGYLSTLFDLCGVPGVVITGWLSDRYFGSRRAGVSFLMLSLMTATTVFLYVVGRQSVPVFAISLGIIGFTLYGPDALLTGAGAMDIGSRRGAALAAGLISGFGSMGSVFQELVIGHLYDEKSGDLGRVFLLLLVSASLCLASVGLILIRNRMGRSQV